MASKYLQKYPVPVGFQEILSDFARQVLRDQPQNIIQYGAKYFESLESGKKFEFNSKNNVGKDEKKYELSYNPKNAEEITKKASNIAASIQNQTQQKIEEKQQIVEVEQEHEEPKNGTANNVEMKIHQIFEEFDQNKNGYLESKEVRNFVNRVISVQVDSQRQINEEELEHFIEAMDTNHDGKVSKQQLKAFILKTVYDL